MIETSMKEMLEAGVHFGHQAFRWNPKMAPFIFTVKNGVHIFDLVQTQEKLQKAIAVAEEIASKGGVILFVGTKKQAKEIIKTEAERAKMPFINDRWLGGLLTNFSTIARRISYFKDLEKQLEEGADAKLSKKDNILREKEFCKLKGYLGGIKDLKKLPDALFVIDTHKEGLAISEANKLNIPVIGIVDSNANPDPIDYVIPGNDDAVRSIKYITSAVASAILEGSGTLKEKEQI
ncbi:TPA: 30S ribosomal protein S2 [candidate division CPR2 bacterium]|uniref:Small ribosomal subunit protein uS2 n=1 Tax=candidate division CPR2 bacterium GW2011_GWC1_41_48 TaxID=1618344 RepID=A0A0G0YJJ6_UNCC2|nr:MAG: 30S ribosomal protein S2 [candidate division CPR2 bacterium GW2011_GWC2_39_35]KKR27860.1 MAG: 30S ribosomal protein S2 [candidate division CPR2 bacterium GW2011_GWD2_39_7]KKR28730.1 MAG: 30S ribosomal protein S2 [candidate division CPR2 bacterium GW2011_GWD1_39_7]KKS09696.1 MAG: 30S ribosomal protein S2 [candidate division CPR2 bacterium GW2011_GWC1_41_48]OGB61377.1 MAG: 30S ribosomal protein S2 [candidate division CPR2 bacterium GWD1_39_7]OGB71959.1 MAG: 30S ribosomal protein S2 [cand